MKQYFIQSFSKGQVTIPKAVRSSLGIGDDFVLKIEVHDGKIIAEPIVQEQKKYTYPTPALDVSTVFDMASKTKNGKNLSDKDMIDIAKEEHYETK